MHFSTQTILFTLLSPLALAAPAKILAARDMAHNVIPSKDDCNHLEKPPPPPPPKPIPYPIPAPLNRVVRRNPTRNSCEICPEPITPFAASTPLPDSPPLHILVLNPEDSDPPPPSTNAEKNLKPNAHKTEIPVYRIPSNSNANALHNPNGTAVKNSTSTPTTAPTSTTNSNNIPGKIIYRVSNFTAYIANADPGGESYVEFTFHDDRPEYAYEAGCAVRSAGTLFQEKYYPCGEDRRTWFQLSPWGIIIRYTWRGRSMAMTGVAPQSMNWQGAANNIDVDIVVAVGGGGKSFTRTSDWPFPVESILAGEVAPPS